MRILAGLVATTILFFKGGSAVAALATFDPATAGLTEIRAVLDNKRISCAALVETYLDRIQRYDLDLTRGAPINAVLLINPNVRKIARQLDQDAASGKQGSLHCVPVILKDNIDTYDHAKSNGSLALLDTQPRSDATVAARLRAQGAVILGSGGMSEFASWDDGRSGRSGYIGNAYDPTKSPSGSSAGTAAAVAAGFVPIGLGTDTARSIRGPAGVHSLIGLRGSFGRVSLAGIFPDSLTLDVVGPIGRSVADVAAVEAAIAGPDPKDPATGDAPDTAPEAWRMATGAEPRLDGVRIGVIRMSGASVRSDGAKSTLPKDRRVNFLFQHSIELLRKLGATVVDPVDLPDYDEDYWEGLWNYEHRQAVDSFLKEDGWPGKSLADIAASGRIVPANVASEARDSLSPIYKDGTSSPAYKAMLTKREAMSSYINDVMNRLKLDLLIYANGEHGFTTYKEANAGNPGFSNLTGMPAITLPIGFSTDARPVPTALEMLARKWSEPRLLEIAAVFEAGSPSRTRPTLTSVVPTSCKLPPLDIDKFNAVKRQIGVSTAKLYRSNTFNLSRFSAIVRTEADAQHMSYLVDRKAALRVCRSR